MPFDACLALGRRHARLQHSSYTRARQSPGSPPLATSEHPPMQTMGDAPNAGCEAAREVIDEADGERPKKLRILVVEDEPAALAATVNALEALGHFAAGASSAEVARARFLDGAFDVLITDIGLPGLSGDDMVQDIRREACAPLAVIYATGRSRPPGSGAIWLQKPYRLEDLEAALTQAEAYLADHAGR